MQDSTEVRVAPSGRILTAPAGTSEPVNLTAEWPAGWVDLGFASEDGVEISPELELTRIPAWQSAVPVKIVVQAVQLTFGFNLLQTNADNLSLYFFGQEWTELSAGVAKLNIPSSPIVDERKLGIEWNEGAYVNRFVVSRGIVTDRESVTLSRADATAFGVTFEALDSSGNMGYLLSNDPNVLAILES